MPSDIFKDILPSILQTKKNVLTNPKDYVPYVVNKALSFHYDCVMFANHMNQLPNIPSDIQYAFYLNTVRSYKRPFQKWHKLEKNEAVEAIKEYYGYSTDKARATLEILSDEQIEIIKKNLYKGGLNDRSIKTGGGNT